MKNIIYVFFFLFVISLPAQEKPKNVSEESTIKIVKTNNGSGIVEQKIKVTTREEQDIEFADQDENKRDKDVIDSPVKIKKTVEVDDDMGNSYDSKTEVGYYEFNGNQYGFKKVDNGFSVLLDDNKTKNGDLVKFNKENHYIYQNGDDTGIGYFNEDGSFTIEFYDKNTRQVISQDFILKQK